MASSHVLCDETVEFSLDESIEGPAHSSTKGCDSEFVNETLALSEEDEGDYHPLSLLDTAIIEEEGEESFQEDEGKENELADKMEEETLTEIVRGVEALNIGINTNFQAKKTEHQQQLVSHIWVLPNFKANLGNYLDSEHRHGSDRCALRTVLLNNGEAIWTPTTHLVNLFLTECSGFDENQNTDHQRNRNLMKDGEQEGGTPPENDLFIEIVVRCVEAAKTDRFVYTHFKAYVESKANGIITAMDTPKFHLGKEFVASSGCKIRWGLLKPTLNPEDPVQICIKHTVGSTPNPTEWGLNPKEEQIMKEFMHKGKLHRRDETVVRNIIKKCEEDHLNLPTVADCLRATGIKKD